MRVQLRAEEFLVVNIAYLMNAYPMTSTTFIRREIEALESLGLRIHRHAVRTWAGKLVDPRDIAEKAQTHYLLAGNVLGLIAASIREVFCNPRGLMRASVIWIKLLKNSGGGLVKHIAYLMQAAYFRQLAQSEHINHVHVHFATNATAVALLSRMMGGPSYSFTVHGPDELIDPEKLSFGIKIRHAAFVVAISNYCKNELLRAAPAGHCDKIIIARCALALEEFDDAHVVNGNSQMFVCVGRLCPQKGQVLIPRAAAELRNDFPNLKIVLAGDGESRPAVEAAIAAYGVADMIELRGWVANSDVLDLVKKSRALLLPSYAEGLPVVIMEALASGRPVISTTIAGIPELVDDSCGWLFPAGDQEALVTAIRAALECAPTVLARMGEAGRDRVVRLHDRRELAKLLYKGFECAVSADTAATC
jgi:glycosyltransferase involved in cell wall biosynthesis